MRRRLRLLLSRHKASTTTEQFAQKATCKGGFFGAAEDELSDSVIINHGMGKEE